MSIASEQLDVVGSWRFKLATLIIAILPWIAPAQAIDGGQLWIASNGVACASIVLGVRATEVEKFAAAELKRYVKAISGAELPIAIDGDPINANSVILLGTPESNRATRELQKENSLELPSDQSPGADGFVIKTIRRDPRSILVLGSSQPRGVLFAVYGFLEDYLGVRFFGFGSSGEIVPTNAQVRVADIDHKRTPKFKLRFVNDNNFLPTNRAMLTKVADWAAKNGFNAFLLSLDEIDQVATEELTKRGMEIWGGGHVWGQFTPAKALFDSHPEYFPFIDGKRTFTGDATAISFCYSNPDAMRMFVAKACEYARKRPMMDVFACWPQDGSQHWAQCQCADCKQYTFSDWNLTIVNRVASAFESDPRLSRMRIQWIAYDEASVPPVKIKPHKRGKKIDLLYTNGARDYLTPMNSPSNRKCAYWLAMDTARKQINTDFKEAPGDDDLAAYQRLESMLTYLKQADYEGNICLLEYVNGHIGYWLELPYLQHVETGPWPDTIFPKDMQFYRSRGISGWSDCFDWPNDFPDPFWNRLIARVLWDPDSDIQQLKDDFYSTYYGTAGSVMQGYFSEIWDMLYRKELEPGSYERLKQLRSRLQKAQQMTAADPATGKRVSTVVSWHDSVRLAKPSTNLIDDGSFEDTKYATGKSSSLESLNLKNKTGDWRVICPAAAAAVKPTHGLNYLQASGAHSQLWLTNAEHVFEAATLYKLEADIFPVARQGVIGLAAPSEQVSQPGLMLAEVQLADLQTNKWNHIKIEWLCQSGSAAEGKSIAVFCKEFSNAFLDNLVLKASYSPSKSP